MTETVMNPTTWIQARPQAVSELKKWRVLRTYLKKMSINIDDEYELRTLLQEWADQRILKLRESEMLGNKRHGI